MRGALHAVLGLALLASLGAGGDALHLVSLDDRPVVLRAPEAPGALVAHFWATWCTSCMEELPALARAADRCDPAAVRIVAVDVGEPPDVVAAYLGEHPLRLEVLSDPRGEVWRDLSGAGLPLDLTWTATGRETKLGARSEAEWRRVLAELGCDPDGPSVPTDPGS